jgi:hypothetical protein
MRIAVVLLAVPLAASIAAGLLGLWPDLRSDSTGNRRDEVRISAAVNRAFGKRADVTRVRVDYLPGRALVEVRSSDNGSLFCYLVVERFGQRVDRRDATRVACDF